MKATADIYDGIVTIRYMECTGIDRDILYLVYKGAMHIEGTASTVEVKIDTNAKDERRTQSFKIR